MVGLSRSSGVELPWARHGSLRVRVGACELPRGVLQDGSRWRNEWLGRLLMPSFTAQNLRSTASNQTPRLIAVTGSKGGVGKTTIAVNLALCLAAMGRKVVLVDADRLGGNVHTVLGLKRPALDSNVTQMDADRRALDQDGLAVVATPYPDLHMAFANVDQFTDGLKNLRRYARLADSMSRIEADHVVIDLGDGTDRALIDLFLSADFGLYLTSPDPASVENIQRFLRASVWRQLQQIRPTRGSAKAWTQRLRSLAAMPAPSELLQRLEAEGDPTVPEVQRLLESFRLHLVVNQIRVRQDLQLGDGLATAVRRRMGLQIDYIGHISHDEAQWLCMRKRRPLMVESPGSKAGRNIEKIVRRALSMDRHAQSVDPVPPGSYFGWLGLGRGATDEEVRRAYKRMKEIYSLDSLSSYGLFEADELENLRSEIDEAYEVLLDPGRRRVYEHTLFATEEPPHVVAETPAKPNVDALSLFPEIGPDTQYNGALLRAIREAQGIELGAIARQTKIGLGYLKAIEEDDFSSLPEKVYVRGYVAEFAKMLRLDAKHVSRTYIRVLDKHRGTSVPS